MPSSLARTPLGSGSVCEIHSLYKLFSKGEKKMASSTMDFYKIHLPFWPLQSQEEQSPIETVISFGGIP